MLKDSINLTKRLEQAFENSFSVIFKTENYSDTSCYITFMGTDLWLPEYTERRPLRRIQIWNIEQLKQTEFYMMLRKIEEELEKGQK